MARDEDLWLQGFAIARALVSIVVVAVTVALIGLVDAFGAVVGVGASVSHLTGSN